MHSALKSWQKVQFGGNHTVIASKAKTKVFFLEIFFNGAAQRELCGAKENFQKILILAIEVLIVQLLCKHICYCIFIHFMSTVLISLYNVHTCVNMINK